MLYFGPKHFYSTLIKLLCLGDAHLGRYPSRVPTDNPALSVRSVWKKTVTKAIDKDVDAMILTGDMADNINSYFEAYGILRKAIVRLRNSGIPVIAVAGNHDYKVFPKLVESMSDDNFIFLGQNGSWSEAIIKTRSGRSLRCVGWSFPDPHYKSSPLDTFHHSQSENFTVGIIHGDLEGQGKYAPLARRDLDRQPVDLWLLGHVHAPKLHEDYRAPVLYPGSPQPLDPGEPGTHGPWMITIDDENRIQAEQLPIATVRYEEIPIDVSNADEIEHIHTAITDQLEQRGRELTRRNPALRHLCCRLQLRGQTRLHRKLSTEGLTNIDMFDLEVNECSITIDKVSFYTTPNRDIQEIAQLKNDPPGMLARWLIELKHDHHHELLKRAHSAAEAVYRSTGFHGLAEKKPDPETLSSLVNQQALLLLDELLSQKENDG